MSNCDWGHPCTCKECRTIYSKVICPSCGFENSVSIVREVDGYSVDKKGIGSYDFKIPQSPNKDLQCYKCKHNIPNVGYYTEVNNDVNRDALDKEQAIKDGNTCSECNAVEGDYSFLGRVKLTIKNGKKYCQKCLAGIIKNELPDPSNENEKYVFDERTLKWVLSKIMIECESCGRKRWLNQENKWKKLCQRCYALKATESTTDRSRQSQGQTIPAPNEGTPDPTALATELGRE